MNLNFMGPVNTLGYGVTTVNIVYQLLKKGHDVSLFVTGPTAPEPKYTEMVLSQSIAVDGSWDPRRKHSYDPAAPMIRNFHEFNMAFPPGTGKRIAWPFFEINKLRPVAIRFLNSVDAIASASAWKDTVFRDNDVTTKLFRAPQGVDTDVFRPMDIPKLDKTYKFFTVGKFETRKGHPELIKAFKAAFPTEHDVMLYMMVNNPFMGPLSDVATVIAELSGRDSRIHIVPPVASHHEVAVMMNRIDCAVFPTRGEGWGLPILEALACGRPVISTFVTSHKEFVDDTVALEVETEGLAPARDGQFFHGDGEWYTPSVLSLAQRMRQAYDEKRTTNPAGRVRAMEFTWSKAADMLLEGVVNV